MSDSSYTAMHQAFDAETSHAACMAAFTAALAAPTYRFAQDRWPLDRDRGPLLVDQDIQALFGDDEALGPHELAPRWAELMRCKFLAGSWNVIPKGIVILGHWQGAASLMHWGSRFELLRQDVGPDGQPVWRRVRREPSFVLASTFGCDIIRIRGLPPEQQAAQYARERKRAATAATWARKGRDKADAEIQRIVDGLVKAHPNFVAGGDHSLQKRLPEICHTRTIAAVSPMIADAHQRLVMGKDDLKAWKRDLSDVDGSIRARSTRIERGAGPGVLRCLEDMMGPPPPVAPAILPADAGAGIPTEDVDVLEGLAP